MFLQFLNRFIFSKRQSKWNGSNVRLKKEKKILKHELVWIRWKLEKNSRKKKEKYQISKFSYMMNWNLNRNGCKWILIENGVSVEFCTQNHIPTNEQKSIIFCDCNMIRRIHGARSVDSCEWPMSKSGSFKSLLFPAISSHPSANDWYDALNYTL